MAYKSATASHSITPLYLQSVYHYRNQDTNYAECDKKNKAKQSMKIRQTQVQTSNKWEPCSVNEKCELW